MPFVEAVVQLSEQQDVDLVVMCSTGSSGLRRILMGSNTLQMVKGATRPLLVVLKGTDSERIMSCPDIGCCGLFLAIRRRL